MENMTISTEQPKKTWQEPELLNLDVYGSTILYSVEDSDWGPQDS